MANFVATTASNGARLKEPKAAQRVLDRFAWDGDVKAVIHRDEPDGIARLHVYGSDWPSAWKRSEDVNLDDFEPDYDIDNSGVFEEFLLAIAPHLAESLAVQAVGAEACRFPISACEWFVAPGATKIEVTGFKHSHDDQSDAA